ncbi:MAG: hypothetical protein LBD07_02430 [Spirochaetaceae bacterium]|jgi:hypothetical protein|nr:hypothetical protein [Spirochaetaceae bacterium]
MNENKLETVEDSWCFYVPLLELSILSYIRIPKEWHHQWIDGKFECPKISEDEKTMNKNKFINSIVKLLKSDFDEIEIIAEDSFIEKEIESLCNRNIESIHIKIYVNIGFKRQGYLFFEIIDNKLLHTEIYFSDEMAERKKYRNKSNKLLNKMMEKLNGFCGTLGLESNVHDIFNINNLLINIGDKENYGIENVYWKI